MNQLLAAVVLAVVQGLTEFLPVSSSGHLVLMQHWLGSNEGDVFFVVALHVGTLGSVLVVYRREVQRLLRLDDAARSYVLALALGTVPAVIVGVAFKDAIEDLFGAPRFAAGGLLLTAALLVSTRLWGRESAPLPEPWEPRRPAWRKALLVGTAQALAILPGVSRSGSTIAASLWLGLPRAEAARFSFLLSVPAIAGALVLQLADAGDGSHAAWSEMAVGAAVAFGVGLLAIRWTALAVVQAHFWKFSLYCLMVGVVGLLVL